MSDDSDGFFECQFHRDGVDILNDDNTIVSVYQTGIEETVVHVFDSNDDDTEPVKIAVESTLSPEARLEKAFESRKWSVERYDESRNYVDISSARDGSKFSAGDKEALERAGFSVSAWYRDPDHANGDLRIWLEESDE
jgi:hypothetical protein